MKNEDNRSETLTYENGTPVGVRNETSEPQRSSGSNLEVSLQFTKWIREDTGEVLKYVNENEFLDRKGAILRRTWQN